EGRATAGIAIQFREHDAGDADTAVELAGALDGVLPRHRIGDVQQVGRIGGALDRDELVHQVIVDVEAARGVDDDEVEPQIGGLGDGALRPCDRIHLAGRVVNTNPRLPGNDGQLFDRGRPLDVG